MTPLPRALLIAVLLPGAMKGFAAGTPSFRNDVMAALSKASCNLGTCHGNASGKGGFKLSLRGEDMDADHAALSRDVAGRRVNPFLPEESLILLKGANQLTHEGGKRLDPKDWEYRVLRDWIAGGLPAVAEREARLEKLEVTPLESLVEERQDTVQLRAHAHFSDGTLLDVTDRAVYEPLQNGLVEVSPGGLVRRLQFGEPTVLVRYLEQSVPVRLTFLQDRPGFVWANPVPHNFIDRHIFEKLRALRVNPSGLARDEVFLRRAWLDLTGSLPPASEARDFVADTAPDKRARLVDRLLASPKFADFWALKWADVLKVEGRTLDEKGMAAFHAWIREGIARNRPLDGFVRDMLAARGSTYSEPPANFYRANRTAASRAVTAAQVFLGTRLQCAECHNQPFDRWTQDDYYNWSAVFGQVDYQILDNKRRDRSDKHEFVGEQVVFLNPKLGVQNPRTGEAARPRFLGAEQPELKDGIDPLQAAAEWLTRADNPLFAKAQANRIWYHLMGRGLVDPVDDLRQTNPASHPKLLDELTRELVDSGFDLRHLIRRVMLSRTYQLASAAGESLPGDEANYARNLPRRLSAEQLFDSIHGSLGTEPVLKDVPAGQRAAQLAGPRNGRGSPDPMSPEAFLVQFGRPKRELSCECERAGDSSIGQIFQFISGPVVAGALAAPNGLPARLAAGQEVETAVDELFWSLLTRAPSMDEARVMAALLASAKDRRAALEDIAWSLLNAKEFVLRH